MKIQKILFFCLILTFVSCKSSQKLYESQSYDELIDKYVVKAKKGKINAEELDLLTKSYHEANESDHNKIIDLKKSGQPEIWISVYHTMCDMKERQNKIVTLSDGLKDAMNFRMLDLDDEIDAAKTKAELYICAKVNLLLKNPDEKALDEAKYYVNQLCAINPHNRNIDEYRLKLIVLPSERILLRVAAPNGMELPEDFAKLVLDFDDKEIYGVPFDIVENKDMHYGLMMRIMLEEVLISPERTDAVTFEEKNAQYTAKVTDKTMSKSATVKGVIEFVNMKNKDILLSTPFNVASNFVYKYAEIEGDRQACSEQTLELSDKEVIDFPTDAALVRDVARKLNYILKDYYQKK